MNKKNVRFRYGIFATVITVMTICFIVLANIIVEKLTDKYDLQVDLTANNRYAISEDTINYIKQLNSKVEITVLVSEEDMATGSYYIVQAYQNLLQYEKKSNNIELKFVDLIQNPTFVSRYEDLELNAYDIIVERGERHKVLSFSELYGYDETGTQIVSSKVEQLLTNAIVEVTTTEKNKAVVLGGYDKIEPTDLISLLEGNQYEVQKQSLITEEIAKDADVAILYAPQKDLGEQSILKIEHWLENDGKQGKSLYVFLDPIVTETPNLNAFLEEWGIVAKDGYAFESNANLYYEKMYYPIAQYVDSEYAEGMSEREYMLMALCRPVDVLFEEKDHYKTSVLLGFSETSGCIELGETDVKKDNITGNVNGMVMSTHSWYGKEVTTSNVVVSGSALAFSGNLVSESTFGNSKYIQNLVDKNAQKDTDVNISSKDLSTPVHSMLAVRTQCYVFTFMIILPLSMIVIAIIVWLKRRHR